MSKSLRSAALGALAFWCVIAPAQSHAAGPAPFVVPAETTIPDGAEGAAIRRGKALIIDTRKLLPNNVGNGLNCTNCHLDAGTRPSAGPYVGLWGEFPEFRNRGGRLISLQERVNDCFERSMHGKPLALESDDMNAILMYMRWLSIGVPVGTEVAGRGMGKVDTALIPDPVRGKRIYAEKCALCHGADGAGTKHPAGGYISPPVWGNASFNIGAGLARTYTAAGFIKNNMPYGQGGLLSDQEAVDVAQFVTHQPRPAFAKAKYDFAKGIKPKDARN